MINLEYKIDGTKEQYTKINEAIRTSQFIQNSCLRYWMDNKPTEEGQKSKSKFDLIKYTTELRYSVEFCRILGSNAVQVSGERAWSAIQRFYNNVKKGVKPVGYPKFKKNVRSVEYKNAGWKLEADKKRITFTDGFKIGTLKLKGTWDLSLYPKDLIKRVRIVRKADGYYVQFCINVVNSRIQEPCGSVVGLDVGLNHFYVDSNDERAANPRFLRKAEKKLKKLNRRLSKKKKGSNNRKKAKNQLGKAHLKVSRQRKDHAIKLARCVMMSNDFVAVEDLRVKNMVKNRKLSKSISDASWSMFRDYLLYYAKQFERTLVSVPAAYTSQDCSVCGKRIKKKLSERRHVCSCGANLDRDHNAALNILTRGLNLN